MTHPTTLVAPWALRRGAPVLLDGKVACSVFAQAFSGGWYLMGGTGGSYDSARVALDCLDPLGRACLRMALAEGERAPSPHPTCPWPAAPCDCYDRGHEWLRRPAPHHWIGTANEGGALTPAHAEAAGMTLDELAGALLVRAAERVVVGTTGAGRLLGVLAVFGPQKHDAQGWYIRRRYLAGIGPRCDVRETVAEWPGRDEAMLASGFALLGDAEGRPALLLPEVTHA